MASLVAGDGVKVEIKSKDGKVMTLDNGFVMSISHSYGEPMGFTGFDTMRVEMTIEGSTPMEFGYGDYIYGNTRHTETLFSEHIWACDYCKGVNTVYDHSCSHCGANPPLVTAVLKRLRVPEIKRLLG